MNKNDISPAAQAAQWAQSLPSPWNQVAQELAQELLESQGPLHVVLVGAFSVGKSSLVNTLIGEKLLPSAREETTALPTFIEQGQQRQYSLAQSNGQVQTLAETDLASTLTCAPAGASHAVVQLPLPWLQGINIIDLPGLGSTSANHALYTRAQIMQADAVLYLLANRGPSQDDIAQLQWVRQLGKRVKVVVTHWDTVQAAIERGEKAPSLEKWATDIEQHTGLRARLAPVDHHGLGKDEVIDFLIRAQQDQSAIRWQRYQSELRPLLENAMGQLAQAHNALTQESEDQIRAMHQQLLDRKQALQAERHALEQQHQQAREQHEINSQPQRQSTRDALQTQLHALSQTLESADQWQSFQEQAQQQLQTQLTVLAECLNQLTAQTGQAQIAPAQVQALNLRLPQPEVIPVEQFLQQANITHLHQQLQDRAQEIEVLQQRLDQTQAADLTPYEQEIKTLLHQRNDIACTPLPQIVEPAQGSARTVGRWLGEIADMALIIVNPAAVGAKAAAVSAKVGKIAKVAVNAQKVAQAVKHGVQAAQVIKQGGNIPEPLKPIADKFNMLEMLSLSYWGEKIGTAIDGPPKTRDDPEAAAQRDQALAEIQAQERELRRQLYAQQDIANERQLTGTALLENQQAQQRLQEQIEERERHARSLHEQHAAMLERQQSEQLQRQAQRLQDKCLMQFDQQASTMQDMARTNMQSYWQDQVQGLLAERMQDVQTLQDQLSQAPELRAQQSQRIHSEQQALETALQALAA